VLRQSAHQPSRSLDAARVNHARLVIIAAPRGFQTQRILDIARQANSGIDTAVRAHSIGELGLLEGQNVGLAIMGERELALGLVDYAFKSLGLSEEKGCLRRGNTENGPMNTEN
jgi:K+:H+ antiporter